MFHRYTREGEIIIPQLSSRYVVFIEKSCIRFLQNRQ